MVAAITMKEEVDSPEAIPGTEAFRKYVHVLLTDQRTKFSATEAMEPSSDGTRQTRSFY